MQNFFILKNIATNVNSYLSGQLNEIALMTIFLPVFISATWFITKDILVSGLPSVSK